MFFVFSLCTLVPTVHTRNVVCHLRAYLCGERGASLELRSLSTAAAAQVAHERRDQKDDEDHCRDADKHQQHVILGELGHFTSHLLHQLAEECCNAFVLLAPHCLNSCRSMRISRSRRAGGHGRAASCSCKRSIACHKQQRARRLTVAGELALFTDGESRLLALFELVVFTHTLLTSPIASDVVPLAISTRSTVDASASAVGVGVSVGVGVDVGVVDSSSLSLVPPEPDSSPSLVAALLASSRVCERLNSFLLRLCLCHAAAPRPAAGGAAERACVSGAAQEATSSVKATAEHSSGRSIALLQTRCSSDE